MFVQTCWPSNILLHIYCTGVCSDWVWSHGNLDGHRTRGGNIPMQLLATEGVTGQLLLQYNWFVFSFFSIVSTNLFDRVGLMQFTNVIG